MIVPERVAVADTNNSPLRVNSKERKLQFSLNFLPPALSDIMKRQKAGLKTCRFALRVFNNL
jgi:hypothetical protein